MELGEIRFLPGFATLNLDYLVKRPHCHPSASAAVRLLASTPRQAVRKGRRHTQEKRRALWRVETGTSRRRGARRKQPGPASLANDWECPSPNRSAWPETNNRVRSAWNFLLYCKRAATGPDAQAPIARLYNVSLRHRPPAV